MSTDDLLAIDVHGHYGHYRRGRSGLVDEFMTGDGQRVAERAHQARTRLTIVSPLLALLPRGQADAAAGNEEAARIVPQVAGLLQWVVLHPFQPKTFEQAERMLGVRGCVGIKIHPEEHLYPVREQGRKLFEFAAGRRAIVLTHSGEAHSMPEDLVDLANDFPEMALILAHLGCGHDGDPGHQVRAIQKSRHGNVYVDTSSAQSIMPGLIEWAVKEIGADRLLYGTDTPLYFAPMQRARIDHAQLADEEKRQILCGNAERLFGLA
ncbi:MAG: amidohydrolase [Planctomycetes bacterium]|nr:amidohydrolase [Planctomycetota bacterium]